MSHDYELATPRASDLWESLRAFGYDLPTAVADIIDNSISAEAANVWIDLSWAGALSRITIRDDGKGMTESQLKSAMRPGSQNPNAMRSEKDLGRFGLGMKTASISQCRRLTVVSKVNGGEEQIRCWDLDYIAETAKGEWRLLKGKNLINENDRALLAAQGSGTILFWDKLDRLVGDADDDSELVQRSFRAQASILKQHLEIVFHRYLTGPRPLKIYINKVKIEPWDPFLETIGATDPQQQEVLTASDHQVEVKPFVLPHVSRLTPEQHSSAAGTRGWNAHQGFYVYRNKRLLVAGDWLDLGIQKEEHYKLARIRVDLGNDADASWQIDVKKSRAQPPPELKKDLLRIARASRSKAASVYRHRGKVMRRKLGDQTEFIWKHMSKRGKNFYKINRSHPIVKKLLSSKDARPTVNAFISIVEQTIPVPHIVIENAEKPNSFPRPFEGEEIELLRTMSEIYYALLEAGKSPPEASKAILIMEPFNEYPEQVAAFLESVSPISS